MTRDEIIEVQMLLNGHDNSNALKVDGIWGDKTRNALIAFQTARGLTPDGIVSDATRAALRGPKAPLSVATGEITAGAPGATGVGGLVITTAAMHKLVPSAQTGLVDAIVSNVALLYASGITTKRRAAYFLGQVCTETGGLESISENLNYSTTGLRKTFGRHRISDADCERYGRNASHPADQEAIANLVYGGEWGRVNLGNTQDGDGWRFRGGGMFQTTGRANYRRAGHENDPETLRVPITALKSALKFWTDNNLARFADASDVRGLRKAVNGGTNGLDEAIHYTEIATRVL